MARKSVPNPAQEKPFLPPTTQGEALTRGMTEQESDRAEIPSNDEAALTTRPPRDNPRGEVVSDLAESYVAGSTEYSFIKADRALPQTIDDAEVLYGIDIYDRMKREPILGGIERILKILTLADGLSVNPSHEQPAGVNLAELDSDSVDTASKKKQATNNIKDPKTKKAWEDYQKADYCARYVRSVIARLGYKDRPILRTLWNLLDATRLGHKVAEVTYDYIEDGEFKGMMGISEFRTKPRKNYAFIVDEMNRFRGIIAKVPGGSIALRQGLVFDSSKIANCISPEKLVCLTFDDQDGDPRGVSWWRDLYDPWYRKQLFKPEHLKTGIQFGGGMISITMPENKRAEPVDDPSGGQISGAVGGKVSLQAATLWAGMQLRNGGVGTFEFGTNVTVHKPDANGSFFADSFSMFDREMVTAYLNTARSILEAKHGSKADTDSAQDLLDELKMYIRTCLCELITIRLFRTLIFHSLGPEWLDYCPVATMARTSRPDFPANATAVAQLAAVIDQLAITNNQKEYLKTQVLGLPPSENEPEDEEAEANDDGDETEDPGSISEGTPVPKGKAAMSASKKGDNSIKIEPIEPTTKAESAAIRAKVKKQFEDEKKLSKLPPPDQYKRRMEIAYSDLVKVNNGLTGKKYATELDERNAIQGWADGFHKKLYDNHLEALILGAKQAGAKEKTSKNEKGYSLEDWQDDSGKWHQGLRAIARGVADTETQYLHGYTDKDGGEHRGFINDLFEHDPRYYDEETGQFKPGSLDNRTNLYVGKMRGTTNQSFIDSSNELNPDFRFSWALGPKEHCDDCLSYAAILKDRPADEFFAYPGNGDSVCLGNCGCDVVRDDGVRGFTNHDEQIPEEEK